jgi:hypothetical protein
MALIKKNSPAAAPAQKFEAEPESEVAVAEKVEVDAPADQTAVAVQPAASVSATTRTGKLVDVLGEMKNTLTVDYNTLTRLQVIQGSYLLHETKTSLGDTIEFELLSYQDQFVISPNEDGEEAAAAVRYSRDGKVTQDGEDCVAYLSKLRAVYPNANMKPRCILVINLTGVSKPGMEVHCDKLYQVDLAQTSKEKFDTFRIQAGFHVSRGRKTADQAVQVRSTVSSVTKGKLTWSVADFTYAT